MVVKGQGNIMLKLQFGIIANRGMQQQQQHLLDSTSYVTHLLNVINIDGFLEFNIRTPQDILGKM